MRVTPGLLAVGVLACVVGCAQTDPASVCDHIAGLQHAADPNAAKIKEYNRLCVGPMTQAKLTRPEEYRCWSKCIVGVTTWEDSVRCDGCVGSNTEFELFQLSKKRKKEQELKRQQELKATPPASAASSTSEGGTCGSSDAACGP